ncbi:MAG: methionyl-tRNA formyltransferase [Oscillospiraceae bacterium]|nr:methionyl-tRNA formyltransferase [Oscillospiraceae bacterium]MDD7355387.1 methionyl-tRNA formyltransferase [Oscillospiraceae bacterium]MDY3938472.1 methionyl-tRNA formyltransferase [Oscillospiraceae bacterium]
MKIIYMGTPDFAVPCLERLIKDGYDVCLAVTQPDKAQGRKMILTPSPVKVTAEKNGVEVFQPVTLKSDEAYDKLKSYNPDFIVVAAYGKILPKRILDIPKYACINVHGSLLPKYRGAAPIQRAVIDGMKTSGVTTMLMGEGLDTGDMLLKYETEIGENETAGELFDRLAEASPDLLVKTLEDFALSKITPEKQDESKATYASMLSKDEALIDWNEPSDIIHNKIRGMSPWPVAFTHYDGKKLKIYQSEKTDKSTSALPGTVSADKNSIYVSCSDGKLLKILSLQAEGAKRLDAKQFSAGHRDLNGCVLG